MNNIEAYGLNWVGKKAARAEAFRNIRADFTLRPSIEDSVNFNTTHNLYIEGDNLTVMKLLQESYLDRIKMIYIDPPYNTGNDFIYRDNFTMDEDEYDEETELYDEDDNRNFRRNRESNPRFHSDWCSMIYSRLICAKNLLARDGVIFISIDDHEQANLRKICDEVFGERNFLAQVIWERAYAPVNLKKHFSPNHDYILCYARDIERAKCNGLPRNSEMNSRYKNPDDDPRGVWKAGNPTVGPAIASNIYEIVTPSGRTVLPPKGRSWVYSQERFAEMVADNRIYFGADGNNVPSVKIFLTEVKQSVTPMTIWKYIEVGHSQDATKALKELFGNESVFTYPKPVELIKRCLELYSKKDSIVLDFFSGSATTAHAVMQLNAEDGGNRRFIMVQLPEDCNEKSEAFKAGYSNICEIGKERIRRAGQKLKAESPLTTEQLDVGFRVLKLDTTNYRDVYHNSTEWLQLQRDGRLDEFAENIKPDRTALDLLFGCMVDWGFPLTLEYSEEQVDGYTLQYYGDIIACFDKNIPRRIFEYLAVKNPRKLLFRDESFADGVYKLNVMTYFKHYAPDIKIEII